MAIVTIPKRYFNVEEIAEGLHLAKTTVRGYINSGRLKGRKIGRCYYVSSDALQEFLDAPERP